ncbi:hypothetical protein CDO52_12875 [Nocardiopsis gilva YIM 90087]|uniref:Uncharacterized protein n=1 Tax=Nocardiopsis gilva YIM 90087 TaxID=1235441 RepID=A0A223S639_9ACTN|nr:hypothetical protein [Nocardiopsis gilva]ASU83562.1 hypothetical protein CDO52_12875 [Nocardiopsis gilva YIM 90087]
MLKFLRTVRHLLATRHPAHGGHITPRPQHDGYPVQLSPGYDHATLDTIARVLDSELGHTWCDDCYPAGTDWQHFTATAVINALTRHDQDHGRAYEADGPRGRVYAAIRQTLHQLHPDADDGRPTGGHTALDDDAHRITFAVMKQLNGPCGDTCPRIISGPPLTCELPHGHHGGHRYRDTTWTTVTEEQP